MKTKTQKIKMIRISEMSEREIRLLPIVDILFSPIFRYEAEAEGAYMYRNDEIVAYITLGELEFLSTFAHVSPIVDKLIRQIAQVNGVELKLDKYYESSRVI